VRALQFLLVDVLSQASHFRLLRVESVLVDSLLEFEGLEALLDLQKIHK
jgi:hypothetical protein